MPRFGGWHLFARSGIIQTDRAVSLVAMAGGTANFSNTWTDFAGTGTTAANVSVGTAAYPGTVLLGQNLTTTGTAPTYSSATSSVNDVLRLTGSTPFTAALGGDNVVSIYLSGSGNLGDVFQGGFFSDVPAGTFGNFASLVSSGSYVGYYPSVGGPVTYNGQSYAPLFNLGRMVQVGVAPVSDADFAGGTVPSGQVTTFTIVVPEPGALALAALGLGLAGWAARRRRAA